MPRSQTGGTLEPVLRVPPFVWGKSEARKTWTRMIYPYAPYFFNLLKEIPWGKFRFENDNFTARCNTYTPYVIVGGSTFEMLEKEYKSRITAHIHTMTDPTGDIDVMLPSLIYTPKAGVKDIDPDELSYVSPRTGTWNDFGDAYTRWLISHITAYFRVLEPNFKEWFPNAIDWYTHKSFGSESNYISAENEAMTGERRVVHRVGPFAIYRFIAPLKPDAAPTDVPSSKIQVSMNYYFMQGGKKHYAQEHLIEILLNWDTPTMILEEDEQPTPHIVLPKLGYIIHHPIDEMYGNMDAMVARSSLIREDGGRDIHKFANHVGRATFLIQMLDIPGIVNHRNESIEIEYAYAEGIEKLLTTIGKGPLESTIKKIAKSLFTSCPVELRGSTRVTRAMFERICAALDLTGPACELAPAPAAAAAVPVKPPTEGGSRRRSRSRSRGRDLSKL